MAVLDANFATSPWHSSSELFVNANADGLFHDSSVGNYASINNGGYSASHAGTDSNVGQVPIAAAGPIGVTTTAPVAIAIAGPLTEGSNFQPPPSADVPVHAALEGAHPAIVRYSGCPAAILLRTLFERCPRFHNA